MKGKNLERGCIFKNVVIYYKYKRFVYANNRVERFYQPPKKRLTTKCLVVSYFYVKRISGGFL